MKIFLIVLFIVVISVSVMACDDGKDGVMGLTGPSGVEELTSSACASDEVLTSTTDAGGVVTLTCVAPE